MKTAILLAAFALVALAGFVAALIWARPKSVLHTVSLFALEKHKRIIVIVIAATVLLCTLPMGLSPVWNGQLINHQDQYERITESFLEGRLDFLYAPSQELMELENPYDPQARRDADVDFKWDHSYYNGKYYMYFGVVPVFLVFLPYRVLTGTSLTTYHATQLFTAAFIVGLFALFYQLAKKFFKDISAGIYLYLSVAFSVMSVWTAMATPALYCTAVTAAMATMVWGLYFWTKAAWGSNSRKKAVLLATAGSLLGALTFGCRPTIAMGNLTILALMILYIKPLPLKRKLQDALAFLSPYVVIGVLLMAYNYVRYGSILEFGQSYQLTVVDVHNMPSLLSLPTFTEKVQLLGTYVLNCGRYLVRVTGLKALTDNGTFITFPILLYTFVGLFSPKSRALVKEHRGWLFMSLLLATPVVILLMDVMGSPDVFPRYRMDTLWAFAVLAYVFLGLRYQNKDNKKRFSCFVCYCAIITVIMSVLLFAFPDDNNFTAFYKDRILGMLSGLLP